MKKLNLLLAAIIFSICLISQTPQAFNYQAVVRDGDGQIISNQEVSFRIGIRESTPAGIILYQETHSEFTNDFGVVNLKIGTGTPESGSWSNIDWGTNDKYMELSLDPAGGTAYTSLGTTQLLAVPYALYSESTGAAGNTLDQAYDEGGTGVGRMITADAGAFTVDGVDGVVFGGYYGDGVIPKEGGGPRMMWYPGKSAFRAGRAAIDEWNDVNIGSYSVAMGYLPVASGESSLALGFGANASGVNSISLGLYTIASGNSSIAMGSNTEANQDHATAMGVNTESSGNTSTAMGTWTTASGDFATSMGSYTNAEGESSIAMGTYTDAIGKNSTAMGNTTTASGNTSTAMGAGTIASGLYSTAMGYGIEASGDYSIAIGLNNQSGTSVTQNSTMSIMGGKLGIGTISPSASTDVFSTETKALNVKNQNTTANPASAIWGEAIGVGGVQHYALVARAGGATSQNVGVHSEVLSNTANVNYGIYTNATSANTNYGVFAGISGSGYAGRFAGNVFITGSISKGSGTFTIDHPLDPENKYLNHSFVESPDMMNIYNGNVILDPQGEAIVSLPEWFSVLNKEFRYQLTCIGGFSQVFIAEEVSNNQFKIAGGTPGLKISWQVTGVRQDPYANANRVKVEEMKKPEERGKYLYPEVYGLDESLGIDYGIKKSLSIETNE